MTDFLTNLHIIYTDESPNFSYKTCTSYSMASIVAPQKYYIEDIEPNWNSLKKKYNIPNGVCLHFTDIKALLNPNYYIRSIKYRNPDMEKIFCDGIKLDYTLLYNFYIDVINFIKKYAFKIIVSNSYNLKNREFETAVQNTNLNSPWYLLFKNHLDDLTEYAFREKYSHSKLNFQAKLRYDGDLGLSNKNDIRDAFSNSITTGTSRFNSKTIRTCFDELRFINKKEVGYCSNCTYVPSCTNKNYSHAGNEIVDFIAAYAGKYLTMNTNIDHFKNSFPIKKDQAESTYKKSISLKIGSHYLEPLSVIIPKIYIF
ncbi:hypothetical protein [Clostridium estertheticum]|uniref:hypothetical protein n=1 Tax=Clostridium estertheticum TaxID=238834 RepID=UPI001CF30C6D|nr:hypothetical protein [Clostridium estertheticum]MCB2362199.1 hypothetical protein [Clostridium estertheticum]